MSGCWFRNVTLAATCLLVASAPTLAFVIDGDLSDWNVVIADNNGSDFSNLNLTPGLLASQIEDQDDNAGNAAFLGPNHGGQNYDAEMLAVAADGASLYIAVSTGQRPDNGFDFFGPGDLAIMTSAGPYWLEVGGGPGNGGGSAPAISEGVPGSTYTLKNDGQTIGHANAAAQQTAGSIWTDVNVILDPITPKGPTQFTIDGLSTLEGTADYAYTLDSVTNQHAMIELAIDLSVFGGATLQSVHYRPSCGNDELDASFDYVPEPVSLILLGLGNVVMLGRRRR